jgi:hypothetical protein
MVGESWSSLENSQLSLLMAFNLLMIHQLQGIWL